MNQRCLNALRKIAAAPIVSTPKPSSDFLEAIIEKDPDMSKALDELKDQYNPEMFPPYGRIGQYGPTRDYTMTEWEASPLSRTNAYYIQYDNRLPIMGSPMWWRGQLSEEPEWRKKVSSWMRQNGMLK